MIAFKDIEPKDKELITAYTLNSPRRNCDLSFSNLCSWRFLYDTRYAVQDGFLLMKFWVDGKPMYMLPVGNGNLEKAMDTLAEDADREGTSLCMPGLPAEACEELEALMPGKFRFTSNRDYADYIYLRTDLATLSGKKLQPKRNHVNKFKRTYPDHLYTPITPDRIQECLELEAKWCKANNCDQHEGTGNERRALVYALHHFEELGLTGGILHVGGNIAAFTFGMPINQDTFGVHVEKADTAIDGAYAMINHEFANHIPEQYTYVNREEDLGIEGLRKAKLSYQPTLILEKYVACLKDDPTETINW